MNPESPWLAMTAVSLALMTVAVLVKCFGAPPSQGRFASIDGLRGYLAFFVFLHHAAIWSGYVHTGDWKAPQTPLFAHFGSSSVAVFFMITAFLFFTKLLEARHKPMQWGAFFVGRWMRLAPLYLSVVGVLLVVVCVLSDGALREPAFRLVVHVVQWLGFSVLGSPDINGVAGTAVIIACVAWSLVYEWVFYLTLPILALGVGIMPPKRYLLVGLAGILLATCAQVETRHLVSFGCGIVAALAARSDRFKRFAGGPFATAMIVGALLAEVAWVPAEPNLVSNLVLMVAFALIAAGNTLLGSLVHPLSRALGELAYSLYLLHGLLLFAALTFGVENAAALSAEQHWSVVHALIPVLIVLSFCTFRGIERPGIERTRRVSEALRAWVRGRASARGPRPSRSSLGRL